MATNAFNISKRVYVLSKKNLDSKIIFIHLYSIFLVLILLANITVFIVFNRLKTLVKKKLPNVLLVHQAIVDFLIAICAVPYVSCFMGYCSESTFYALRFFGDYTIYLAVGTLIIGTIERFFCIKYPILHQRYATKHKITVALFSTWLITLTPGFVQIFYILTLPKCLWSYFVATAVMLLFGVLTVFSLLAATYRAISRSIKEKIEEAKSSRSEQTDKITSQLISREGAKMKKVTKVFLLMAIIYTLTMLPLITGQIVVDGLGLQCETNFIIKRSLYLFYMASSLINPFLTLKFKADFSNAVCEFFKCLKN